jgi:UDP-N-acetylmuramate-alanine ligase
MSPAPMPRLSAHERSAARDGHSRCAALREPNLDSHPDLVVIGNALSRGNPEVERVLDERIPFTSMAAVLHDEFLARELGRANRW